MGNFKEIYSRDGIVDRYDVYDKCDHLRSFNMCALSPEDGFDFFMIVILSAVLMLLIMHQNFT